jgi:hydrogenase nickel incorporation protein HypA/HybF
VHELSIADRIVGIASDHAGGRRVTAVRVRVGHLRQVVPSSLVFAFELLAQGTPVDGATLEIEQVPAAARCRRCGSEGALVELPAACGACGGLDVELKGGEELLVEWLELEEAGSPDIASAAGARS